MKPQLTLAALLALGGASLAQDLTKKLDYQTVAIPLSKALADLSKQAGVQLYAETTFLNEPIVLRLKGVTTQEAMDRMAAAMSAEWRKSPDGYELWRSPDLRAKLWSQAIDFRTASLKKALDEKIKQTQSDKPFTAEEADKLATQISKSYETASKQTNNEGWRDFYKLQQNGPDQRVLWRLLARLDPKTLATVGSADRLVLSNLPTRMQRQIPVQIDDLGEQMQEEHNLFAAACKKQPVPKDEMDYTSAMGTDAGTEMKVTPTRFVLTVNRPEYDEGLALLLIVFDSENHVLKTVNGDLSRMSAIDRTMEADRAKLAKETQNEPTIQVTPLTSQLLKFVRSMEGQEGLPSPVTDEVRKALSRPEDLDPLATAASEAFLGVAEHRNENLVFYPDDTMFMVAMYAGKEGSFKPSLVMQTVQGMAEIAPCTVSEGDGWLVMGPRNPLETLEDRTDRAAFGQYLRASMESGTAPLAETAQLASTVHGDNFPMLVTLISMLLDPSVMMSGGQIDLDALRLYACLTPDQLRRLEQQQTVRFAELDQDQLGLVYRYVYNSPRAIQPPMPTDEEMDSGPSLQMQAEMEPTEALPNGLPADGALTLTTDSQKMYFAKISFNSFKMTMPVDTNMLATMLLGENNQDFYKTDLLTIEPGLDKSLRLKLAVGLKQPIEAMVKQVMHVPGGPWTKNNLPEDLKKELAKMKLQQQQAAAREAAEDDEDEGEAAPPIKTPPPAG